MLVLVLGPRIFRPFRYFQIFDKKSGTTKYLVNCYKLNGQGSSTLLGNGVAVTLLEAPSCLDGCRHGKEWRARSGHE